MNSANAGGFVIFGLMFGLLPTLAPAWFPATGLDGSSARAMWLQVMGPLQAAIGLAFLVRFEVLPAIARWLADERRPAPVVLVDSAEAAAAANNVVAFPEAVALAANSEQAALVAAERLETDGSVALGGQHAALRRALKIAFLNEERLVHFFQRFRLFAHGDGDRAHANGTAAVVFGHDTQHALVHLVEAGRIDLKELERRGCDGLRDLALSAFLREIANEVDQVVGDARRAA
jgi:hypothetical protein